MSNNFESDTPSAESVLDPKIMATFHTMIELRMQEVSEVHAQELAIRDAQVTALQNQLASFGVGVGPRYVGFSGIFLALIYYSLVNPALVDEDIPMPLQAEIGLPSLPESSQKKSHNRRDGPSVSV